MRETQPFERPAPRLENVLHYVIARSAGLDFGEVKINKSVVWADSEFYRRYGSTITGAEAFQKQRFGPVPNGVLKALSALRRGGKITAKSVPTPSGTREEYVVLAEPDLDGFTASEIDVINIAIANLSRITASMASDRTHDALWDEIPLYGQIPIPAAAFTPGEIDQEVLAWALSE